METLANFQLEPKTEADLKVTYKIRPGSIAAVMYVEELVNDALSSRMTAVYISEGRDPELTVSGSAVQWWKSVPQALRDVISARFKELFDAPYTERQGIIERTEVATIEVSLED